MFQFPTALYTSLPRKINNLLRSCREQPILTIDQLPQDLPIIILHHSNDPQLQRR
jgi:hypothetical protein